jgi:hypothetical protein
LGGRPYGIRVELEVQAHLEVWSDPASMVQTDGWGERQRERDTHTHTHREREREREREKERET